MNFLPKSVRNTLCKFSGEDYSIIRKCNIKVQNYFSLIGLFVIAILVVCFFSALYFTEHLFHNVLTDIGVGIVWGYIITNLYVLLLYTISPMLLPKKERKKCETKIENIQLSWSMVLRVGLVLLLAIITAQPLNIFFLKPETETFAYDIKYLLSHNFLAWFITILVVAIFILPIYLKYTIRKQGEFYEKKADIEKRIIISDYRDFKQDYKETLENSLQRYNKRLEKNLMPLLNKLKQINPTIYQQQLIDINNELSYKKIEKYEYWENPPYRTKHKVVKKNLLTEEDLLKHIYTETDWQQ